MHFTAQGQLGEMCLYIPYAGLEQKRAGPRPALSSGQFANVYSLLRRDS